MKRRHFLKALACGLAAAAVPRLPKAIEAEGFEAPRKLLSVIGSYYTGVTELDVEDMTLDNFYAAIRTLDRPVLFMHPTQYKDYREKGWLAFGAFDDA